MNLKITGQHIEVSEGMKSHIEEKFEKVKKHFDHIMNVHMIIKVEKNRQIAEATLHIAHHDFFAEESSDDMYKSIDKVVAKLDSQVVKAKNKANDQRKKSNLSND